MSEYTPTTQRVLDTYIWCDMGSTSDEWDAARSAEFNRWLDGVRAVARREGVADGMRSTASWLEGGTPRAYGFQHPCDPPHMRTQPTERELRLMYAVDAIREAADRIENGADQ